MPLAVALTTFIPALVVIGVFTIQFYKLIRALETRSTRFPDRGRGPPR
jgi:hypothetical protein